MPQATLVGQPGTLRVQVADKGRRGLPLLLSLAPLAQGITSALFFIGRSVYHNFMKLTVKVTPRAKQNKIAGWNGDVLRVHVTAPPVDGKANKALVDFLSDEWGVAKSSIKIIKGEIAREKVLEVPGNVPLQNKLI